ncbi:MAG: COX15/CtaA family protein [Verrucomicrobiales bacterium]|nr:COX15/CtaA family protein [Verrucomicrobiales bacterium]
MNRNPPKSTAFQLFAKAVVVVAILLVWWGAATTTKQAGMVFADWPLSLGSFNPPGWLENMIPFLEHSHRLLAKLVGILVLVLFSWSYVKSGRRALEVVGLVVLLAVILGFFIAAGSERLDAGEKKKWLSIALGLSILPLSWIVWSWRARGWSLLEKLTALALLMVMTQAIFGGLRVTEISNGFAVIHGCFAQAFFCVLILIVMVSGKGWSDLGFVSTPSRVRFLKYAGVALVVLVLMQLIFGASMRHFHRSSLPDEGLLLTQGRWIPSFDDPMIAVLFLHKLTAFCILFFVLGLILHLAGRPSLFDPRARRSLLFVFALLLLQIVLGLSVIGTGKSFWITNVHVLNGLAILAISFVFSVKAVRGRSSEGALAKIGRRG